MCVQYFPFIFKNVGVGACPQKPEVAEAGLHVMLPCGVPET